MMNKKYIVEVLERETKEVIKHFEFDNYRKAAASKKDCCDKVISKNLMLSCDANNRL